MGNTILNVNAARLVMGSGMAVAHWTNMKHLITQFLLARCSALCPTNSVKALKAKLIAERKY